MTTTKTLLLPARTTTKALRPSTDTPSAQPIAQRVRCSPPNTTIHRCACGGLCPSCEAKSGTLNISQPNDPAEIEADQIADKVMRMPESRRADDQAPSQSSHENATGAIQRKEAGHGLPVTGQLSNRINASRGGGSALESSTRNFMERRFGTSLNHVRIHQGTEAASLSRDLSAKAFAVGSDIYFADGQYQPASKSGKTLIAHELVHVQQGGNGIRRCTDKKDEAKYDARIAEIKLLDAYKNLDPAAKTKADTIIAEGKAKPDCLYYAKKLKILFTTPEKGSKQVATAIRKETAAAVVNEEKRLETKEAKKTLDIEEAATADPEPETPPAAEPESKLPAKPAAKKKPTRNWTDYPTRFGGGLYKVDATDPANIFIKVKVNLVPGGDGTWDDVRNIKKLEDQIEKHASRKGFTLNLIFVNEDNKPDFVPDDETVKINANPRWPNATNWGGDARTCAHELYHVLNFPQDRYNYIESHASNEKMMVAERLTWFLEQMHKPAGFDNPKSLMASGQYPIEEDICTIARLDLATCLKAREKLAPQTLGFRLRLSGGYLNFGGANGEYAGAGLDLGIPLNRARDWMFFVGANVSVLTQLQDDYRTAFLAGARLGLEKQWSPATGGPNFGAFAGGGAAFLSDKPASGAATNYLPGGYGELGLAGGYKFSPDFANFSIQAEVGVGTTTKIEAHDPATFQTDPKTLQWFQAGLKASVMF